MPKDLADLGFDIFALGARNLGAIAAFLGKPRAPSVIGAMHSTAWFEGYDEAVAHGPLPALVRRMQSMKES